MAIFPKHILVIGSPRQGKTFFVCQLLRTLPQGKTAEGLPTGSRICFVNTQWENYLDGQSVKCFTAPPIPWEGTVNWWIQQSQPEILLKWLKDLMAYQKLTDPLIHTCVAIDEASIFFPRYMNIHAAENAALKDLVCMGNKWNITLIFMTQKVQHMCDLATLCERHVLFHTSNNDIEYLRTLKYDVENPPEDSYEYSTF